MSRTRHISRSACRLSSIFMGAMRGPLRAGGWHGSCSTVVLSAALARGAPRPGCAAWAWCTPRRLHTPYAARLPRSEMPRGLEGWVRGSPRARSRCRNGAEHSQGDGVLVLGDEERVAACRESVEDVEARCPQLLDTDISSIRAGCGWSAQRMETFHMLWDQIGLSCIDGVRRCTGPPGGEGAA